MIATQSEKLLRIFLFGMFLPGTAVYGQSEVIPEAPLPRADSRLSSRNETPIRSIAQYEGVIKDLELAYGAYHNELSEALMGLGLARYTQGDYAAAAEALRRSLHINRVNQGLHDLSQVPILRMLIRTNRALQDWSSLDQNYSYLYWVNRRTYGEKDPRLLEVIYEVAQWHLEAFQGRLDDVPFQHILTARSLFLKAVEIVEANSEPESPELITPLYASALTIYEVASFASTLFEGEQNNIGIANRSGVAEVFTEEQYPLYRLIGDTYREGKLLLERVIAIHNTHPELPADRRALAYIHLGDWYLLFDKSTLAVETYRKAYSTAASEDELPAIIGNLLSEPRSIPALSLPSRQQEEPAQVENYVVASFDVSATGRPINIEIIESLPADDSSMRQQAKRNIHSSRFRPRFENGQPVATTNVNVRYVFR